MSGGDAPSVYCRRRRVRPDGVRLLALDRVARAREQRVGGISTTTASEHPQAHAADDHPAPIWMPLSAPAPCARASGMLAPMTMAPVVIRIGRSRSAADWMITSGLLALLLQLVYENSSHRNTMLGRSARRRDQADIGLDVGRSAVEVPGRQPVIMRQQDDEALDCAASTW